MKKIEIITKKNGHKKSQIIKPKSKSDLSVAFGIANFVLVKDGIKDLDLTSDVVFKVDGEKVSARELTKMIHKELKGEKVLVKAEKSSKSKKTSDLEKDKDGRVVIHSRKTITFSDKKKTDNKKKKKKSKKDDIKKKSKKKSISKTRNVVSKKKKKKGRK